MTSKPYDGRAVAIERRPMLWAMFGGSILGAALLWVLWVLPIAASVANATPIPLGAAQDVQLRAGDQLGIWTSAPVPGLVQCAATQGNGEEVRFSHGPTTGWDTTLWWVTPGDGFKQQFKIAAQTDGSISVKCWSGAADPEGDYLIADDTFMGGTIGLGRSGTNDYALSAVLAIGAVLLPLLALALLPVLIFGPRRKRG